MCMFMHGTTHIIQCGIQCVANSLHRLTSHLIWWWKSWFYDTITRQSIPIVTKLILWFHQMDNKTLIHIFSLFQIMLKNTRNKWNISVFITLFTVGKKCLGKTIRSGETLIKKWSTWTTIDNWIKWRKGFFACLLRSKKKAFFVSRNYIFSNSTRNLMSETHINALLSLISAVLTYKKLFLSIR